MQADIHPTEGAAAERNAGHRLAGAVLYLMCNDLSSTVSSLRSRGVRCTEIEREAWGIRTTCSVIVLAIRRARTEAKLVTANGGAEGRPKSSFRLEGSLHTQRPLRASCPRAAFPMR